MQRFSSRCIFITLAEAKKCDFQRKGLVVNTEGEREYWVEKGGQKNQQYKYYMEDEETRKERASGMFWKAEKQKGMLRKHTYETTVLTSKFIFKK